MKFQEIWIKLDFKKKKRTREELCRKYGSSVSFFFPLFRSNIEREENSKIKVPFYKYKLLPAQLASIAISRIIFDLA